MACDAEREKDYAADEKSSSTRNHAAESSVDVDVDGDASRDIEKHELGTKNVAETTKANADASKEEEIDPNIVDYDGPDDPENPYNWTKTRKWINGGFLSALTFIT